METEYALNVSQKRLFEKEVNQKKFADENQKLQEAVAKCEHSFTANGQDESIFGATPRPKDGAEYTQVGRTTSINPPEYIEAHNDNMHWKDPLLDVVSGGN